MNKLSKKLAAREGFTLVELIVVIAILGILAGVAIPVYSGYITKANEAADYSTLDAVKTAATFATVDHYNGAKINTITVSADGTTITASFDAITVGESSVTSYQLTSAEISTYLGSGPSFKSDSFKTSGATFTASTQKWTPTNAG